MEADGGIPPIWRVWPFGPTALPESVIELAT
jgi:hypothetical protein